MNNQEHTAKDETNTEMTYSPHKDCAILGESL